MKSEQDQDSYYLIQNGTLLRKTQQMAANKAVPKQPESDLIKRTKDWPGPGAYSPRNNMAQTADRAIKYGGSVQL